MTGPRIIDPQECGEVLDFPTKTCKRHVCIRKQYHEIKHVDERAKHGCLCGVTWTKDKNLAGSNWSGEVDLTPSLRSAIDQQRNNKKNNNPNS